MKKMLLITDVMGTGGVETVIVNTLNGIDYSKFDITLFIMYKTEGENNNLNMIPKNVKIKYLFKNPPSVNFQRILYYSLMFFPNSIMNKLIVKENYDIIITTKDVFTYPISSNKSKKIMWTHGGFEFYENEKINIINKLKYSYKKRTYGKFDEIILLTNNTKNKFNSKYNLDKKTHVLYNPINDKKIIKLSNEHVTDYDFKDDLTFVCSCRLSKEKGVERLINVCNKLFHEGYIFNLLILGDGTEKEKIKNIITNSHYLSKRVSLLGHRDNPFKYISKSSMYVSPSYTEGFSLSVAEAMILGLPILSTDCNGTSEILENGKYGLLVENSENGIYDGIKQIIVKPELIGYYSQKSKQRSEFFSFERNVRQLETIINI